MKWFKGTGKEYVEYLRQYPSVVGKRFIGYRPTARKGFEVIVQDKETGRYWMINECRDDFKLCEVDTDAWRSMNMKSFVWLDWED